LDVARVLQTLLGELLESVCGMAIPMKIEPRLLCCVAILSAVAVCPVCAASEEPNRILSKSLAERSDAISKIELKDGQTVLGRVVEQNAESVTIELPVGGRMVIDRELIGSLRSQPNTTITESGEIWMPDPIPDRYLLMPSGIMLKQWEGYFTQAELTASTLTLGLTDYLTIVAGAVVPAWFVRDGSNFIGGVKTGFSIAKNLHLGGGTEAFLLPGSSSTVGMLYGTGTVGTANTNVSLAIGGPYSTSKRCAWTQSGGCNTKLSFSDPVFILSGKLRLTRGLSLTTENWLITNTGPTIYSSKGEVILSLAVRAFGEKWAVDVGALRFPGADFPVPWLNFSYRWN
jgi:hypothetical protein